MAANEAWMKSIIELDKSVAELTRGQAIQLASMKKGVTYLWGIVIVVLALTVTSVFMGIRVDNNSKNIAEIQRQTSSDVLCPLWVRFLRAYNPDSPSAQADPFGYEQSYREIERGATVLGCRQTTRGIK